MGRRLNINKKFVFFFNWEVFVETNWWNKLVKQIGEPTIIKQNMSPICICCAHRTRTQPNWKKYCFGKFFLGSALKIHSKNHIIFNNRAAKLDFWQVTTTVVVSSLAAVATRPCFYWQNPGKSCQSYLS